MPLTRFQSEVLVVLAANRDPGSYVAGATPVNREAARFSGDIDVFHDREDRVATAAKADAAALQAAGYTVAWLRELPALYAAEVTKGDEGTHLEWLIDSDYRFFPAVRDKTFGFVLHPVDLALNKVLAAAGRREVRDLVDLVTVDETILPLGALVWAAADKSPGFTPEGLLAEIRRNANYPAAEWNSLAASEPIDARDVMARLRRALDEAEAFVARMPTDKVGLLFLQDDDVVQPDPDRLEAYQTHAGQRGGQWPENRQISAAMMERYGRQTGGGKR